MSGYQVEFQVPAPCRKLNFRGDRTDQVGRVMGPNDLGEYLQVVAAVHDKPTDTTVLGLAYLPPAERADVVRDGHGQLWLREAAAAR